MKNMEFKYSTVTLLFLLILCEGIAQPLSYNQHIVDSITAQIDHAPNDSNKVKGLIQLAKMYTDKFNPGLILKYGQEADSISKVVNYLPGRVESLGVMSFYFSITGDWPEAIRKINEAIRICEAENSPKLIYLYNLMFLNTAIRNDPKEARIWAHKALTHPLFLSQQEIDKWPTYMQLGLSYEWEDKLDSASYFAEILHGYVNKYHQADLEGDTYGLLGNIARKKQQYDSAIYYYRHGGRNKLGIALVYEAERKRDSAIYYALSALQVAQSRKDLMTIVETTKLLANQYAMIDLSLSNKYLQLYINSKDTLLNSDKFKQLEAMKLNEQDINFEKMSAEKRSRNMLIQTSLIGLVILFLVSALFFFRSNRVKKAANEKLKKTYADLKLTQTQLIQSEKMASLGELTAGIAHEIQNPLNFVNNFSEVNNELSDELNQEAENGNLEQVKQLAKDIQANSEKINHHGKRADAIVKAMLAHSRNTSGTKQLTDINALADEYLRLSYHGIRAKDKLFNATITTDFDSSIGDIDVFSQDIGRVFLNLFNNAFYAVKEVSASASAADNYQPTVSVLTKKMGDSIEIWVKDNGNGIPQNIVDKIFQPFFTTKPAGDGTGLGLSLSYDIVKAHGGEIKVETIEGEGTEFIINLPIAAKS